MNNDQKQSQTLNGTVVFESAVNEIFKEFHKKICNRLKSLDGSYPHKHIETFTYRPWKAIDIAFDVKLSYTIHGPFEHLDTEEEDYDEIVDEIADFEVSIVDTNSMFEEQTINHYVMDVKKFINWGRIYRIELGVLDMIQAIVLNYTLQFIIDSNYISPENVRLCNQLQEALIHFDEKLFTDNECVEPSKVVYDYLSFAERFAMFRRSFPDVNKKNLTELVERVKDMNPSFLWGVGGEVEIVFDLIRKNESSDTVIIFKTVIVWFDTDGNMTLTDVWFQPDKEDGIPFSDVDALFQYFQQPYTV